MPKRRTEIRYNLSGPGDPEEGWETDRVAYALSFSVVSLFLIVRINPFRLSPRHSATESQPLRFSVQFFKRSCLAGGQKFFFFSSELKSTYGDSCSSIECLICYLNISRRMTAILLSWATSHVKLLKRLIILRLENHWRTDNEDGDGSEKNGCFLRLTTRSCW